MSLTGQQLGHYRVASKLGEGGMGVVYRAHDTRLGRDVAIKVLPESVARDPERLARFEREARTLAALNHPNIAAVYGVEQGALVMELVEGETLKGPLPLDTAINYARQIADALEAAHEHGIIHRDLKPANVKITPEGKVKLLDFGLAKAMEQGPIGENSATLTAHASMSGIIVGTPAYMSPEQARGTRVDHRTDIWAFGVVLYEMVTGKRLFDGPTVSDVMAAVLTKDPPLDEAPAQLRPLLTRCLERDPRKRLGWIGDASRGMEAAPAQTAARPRWPIPAIALAALVSAAAVWLLRTPQPPAETPLRAFSFTPNLLATNDYTRRAVISPNGKSIAYVAENRLWIRDLASEQAHPVEGGENGEGPFWSPDNAFIAFVAGNELKKAAVAGGAPLTLANLPAGYRGGTWHPDGGVVLVSIAFTGLFEAPASGGTLKQRLKAVAAGGTLHNPSFIPGSPGNRWLVAGRGTRTHQVLVLTDLGSGESRTLRTGAIPSWSPAGHILFQADVRTGGLWALPFSASTLAARGEAVPFLNEGSGLTTSEDGSAVWVDVLGGGPRRFAWVDLAGKRTDLGGTPQTAIGDIALSPDGARVAYSAEEHGNPDIWLFDLTRSVRTRLTFEPGLDGLPRWSPSGREIAYASDRGRELAVDLLVQSADAGGEPRIVASSPLPEYPQSWSPNGETLLFLRTGPETAFDLWTVHRKPDGSFDEPAVWLNSPFSEYNGSFSPDGKFILYTSTESGHAEVYVRPFPNGGGKRPISLGGGDFGRWSRDGKQIFYVQGNALFSVPFDGGERRELFRLAAFEAPLTRFPYDVSTDGKRFLVSQPVDAAAKPAAIHVIENWPALLRQR